MRRWRRYWRKLFWGGVGVFYLVFIMLGGCADRFILFPTTQPESAEGAERGYVAFEQGRLEVIKARSAGCGGREPEAFVLAFNGNASRAEWMAVPLAGEWGNKAVEVWAVNYPGYGDSTGPAQLRRFPAAGLAIYDALAAEAKGRKIFIHGESLGTTVALHVAAHRPVSGVVLRAPVPLRELVIGNFGWWNLWLAAGPVAMGIPEELSSLTNASQSQAPAAFILIETDEVVPVAYQRRVFDAYRGQKRMIEKAADGHNGALTTAARRELAAAMEWLWNGGNTK
jgi:hypothetical protein